MESDILEALTSLGFSEDLSNQVIKDLELTNLPLEKAVKLAIKELGKNK